MAKKRVMVAAQNINLSAVKYDQEEIKAPHLTGLAFKLFVWIFEAPIIGSLIISLLKKQNKMTQLLRNTMILEAPMFKPEYPPQEHKWHKKCHHKGMKLKTNESQESK